MIRPPYIVQYRARARVENLIRDDLTAWEQSVWLADRKRVYLELYPETKAGGDRGANQYSEWQTADSAVCQQTSFVESTAAQTNISDRVIRENIQIATNLAPFAEAIQDLPIAA